MVLAGSYRVDALLAHGGMADVYRAVDLSSDELVAVKVLRHMAPEQARRFAIEARTLERLDHPAVVRFCASGESDGTPYLVMEHVDGPSLAEVLDGGRPLPVERVVAMGERLAGALAHAHHLGIVHRDVKPGNVLIGSDGLARLADFGIARLADATTMTQTGWLMGTASYLAPEQLEGRHVGPRADIYSLGLVLLEATTGQRAYDGSPTEAAMARLVREPEIPAELPAWWRSLVREMTALGPDFRPSADEVVGRLRQAGDATVTAAMPSPVTPPRDATDVLPVIEPAAPERRPSPSVRRPVPWVPVAVVAAVLLLVVGAFVLRDDAGAPPAQGDDVAPALREALDELEAEVGG
jgi:eukaryotic-like serine/threonine-protein kinase